jgi:hypothetical protein
MRSRLFYNGILATARGTALQSHKLASTDLMSVSGPERTGKGKEGQGSAP